MPFKSAKQRRWMYANEPAMARRWSAEEKRVSKQDRWGNASSRGQRMRVDETAELVEKFTMPKLPTINSLKSTGRSIKTNFQNGMAGKTKLKLAAPTQTQNRVASVSNYAGKNRKPLAMGAAGGGAVVGGYSLMNKADISKRERNYDEEHSRQRRLGGAATASVLGGGALMLAGGKRIKINSKKAAEYLPSRVAPASSTGRKKGPGHPPKGAPVAGDRLWAGRAEDHIKGAWSAVDRRSAAQLAGGATLVATGGGINRYAHSNRNRKWD